MNNSKNNSTRRAQDSDLRLPVGLAMNAEASDRIEAAENKPAQRSRDSFGSGEGANTVGSQGSMAAEPAENTQTTGRLSSDSNADTKASSPASISSGSRAKTKSTGGSRSTGTARKKTSRAKNQGWEYRLGRFFRFILLFCGIIIIFYVAILFFWSRVVGSNTEAEFNRTKEIRDPAFFTEKGHYTENNLRLNIMPARFAGKHFPLVLSHDVTLEKVSVGPGSVVTHYFSISASQVRKQTPEGVVDTFCRNKKLRKSLIDMVDEYRLVYSSGGRKLYRITLNAESCDSIASGG